MDKLKMLLKNMGLSDAQITSYLSTDATATKDLDPEKDALTIQTGMKDALKNDATFIDTLKNEERGKVLGSKENKFIKLFGLTTEELATLPETKRFDEMVQMGYKKLDTKIKELESKSGGKLDENTKREIEELRGKLSTAQETITEYKDTKIPEIQKNAQTQMQQMGLRYGVQSTMADMQKDIIVPVGFAIDPVMKYYNDNFHLKEENGVINMYQKKNPELKAYGDNNKELIFGEHLRAHLETNKLIAKSNGGNDKTKVDHTEQNPNPAKTTTGLRGLDKAKEHGKNMFEKPAEE